VQKKIETKFILLSESDIVKLLLCRKKNHNYLNFYHFIQKTKIYF